ncbi:MAG: ATP-binding cassette domain-containing protein, partial [Halothiobacillus sp.]|nr:ATP-binding cassette domain-containing protein [Halothiobacillus sp.]
MLTLNAVNQYYGGSHILNDINLSIDAGELVCLLGRNGVGKTTLMRSIMGMVGIKSGDIRFDGKELAKSSTEQRARAGIG